MRRTPLPIRRRVHAPSVRGFTVIEVMLALMLSAVVLAAGLGLYRILHAAERTGEFRFERSADLAVTQMTLRKIMNTLVCAPAQPAQSTTTGNGASKTQAQGNGDDEEDQTQPGEQAAILAQPAPSTPVMFELRWQDVDDGLGGVTTAPVVELVVSEPPVPITSAVDRPDEQDLSRVDDEHAEEALRLSNRLTETVRGVIEVVPDPTGWRLQWRPINPAGEPYPLVSSIATAEDGGPDLTWETLSRDEKNTDDPWRNVCSARIHGEFPQAVRLVFETTDNEYTDWLFETHDSVQE